MFLIRYEFGSFFLAMLIGYWLSCSRQQSIIYPNQAAHVDPTPVLWQQAIDANVAIHPIQQAHHRWQMVGSWQQLSQYWKNVLLALPQCSPIKVRCPHWQIDHTVLEVSFSCGHASATDSQLLANWSVLRSTDFQEKKPIEATDLPLSPESDQAVDLPTASCAVWHNARHKHAVEHNDIQVDWLCDD